jgi:DNA-binding CsgD family transcriptional regulator
LELLGRGKTNQEIARKLGSSVPAVTAHGAQIKRKLNLKSANALIRYAVCWLESVTA